MCHQKYSGSNRQLISSSSLSPPPVFVRSFPFALSSCSSFCLLFPSSSFSYLLLSLLLHFVSLASFHVNFPSLSYSFIYFLVQTSLSFFFVLASFSSLLISIPSSCSCLLIQFCQPFPYRFIAFLSGIIRLAFF